MSESPKSPFSMVGSEDAELCVDGICAVPASQPTEQAPEVPDPQS